MIEKTVISTTITAFFIADQSVTVASHWYFE
ncbi:hypothetical protein OA78_0027 [Latilactobacillus curvatus]|nr:hypothetical protein OA78_0027 [Latilactobacillus curvatus]